MTLEMCTALTFTKAFLVYESLANHSLGWQVKFSLLLVFVNSFLGTQPCSLFTYCLDCFPAATAEVSGYKRRHGPYMA